MFTRMLCLTSGVDVYKRQLRVDAQTDALARRLGRRAELCQLGRGVEHDVVGVIQKLVELVHPVGGAEDVVLLLGQLFLAQAALVELSLIHILLSGFDLWRIAARLRLPPQTVARAFCRASIGQVSHLPVLRLAPVKEERNNCPFLTENHCAIHDAEPLVCALYPLAQEISREGAVSYTHLEFESQMNKMEVILGPYSLKQMKKSGRISAAAAVMGELMGIRPIITLIDGKTRVESKVRGDDKVIPAMIDLCKKRTEGVEDFDYMIGHTSIQMCIRDRGYYNNQYRVPSKEYRDFQAFQRREVAKLAKEMVDITHECGCEAMMFLGDHWIGTEPFMPEFKTIGLDAVVGSVGNGSTLRLISDIEGVKRCV